MTHNIALPASEDLKKLKWIRGKSTFGIVLFIIILLAGCVNPIEIGVEGSDIPEEIDVQYEALPILPPELIYASTPELSVENVIKELEKHTTTVHLVDSEVFWKTVVPDTDRLTPAELWSRAYIERLRAVNVDTIVIIMASQLEAVTGSHDLMGTMSAVLIDAASRNPVQKIIVSVRSKQRGVGIPLYPFIFGYHRGGSLDPETVAQKVISNEISRYLVHSYNKPIDMVVLWPVTQETERARKFRGCKGTWEEIKKCVNEKE